MGGGQADGTQGNVAVASHQAQPNAASCPPSGGAHLPLQLCSASLKTPQQNKTQGQQALSVLGLELVRHHIELLVLEPALEVLEGRAAYLPGGV
jgi:hypothetical protein